MSDSLARQLREAPVTEGRYFREGGLLYGKRLIAQVIHQFDADYMIWAFTNREAIADLIDGFEWALDLIDMYDEKLLSMGEPRHLVLSDIHVAGKAKARAALARLKT